MNYSTCIFGELSDGFSQYPDDGSSNLFKEIQSQCIAPSQLIIRRDESMMYYIYVRKLLKDKYIGLAVAVNGYYFTQVQSLFILFEQEIADMAECGVVVNYTDNGELTSGLSSLGKEEEEVLAVINDLHSKISGIGAVAELPPVDFSVSVSSRKIFKETDSTSEIVEASCRYGFTVILKESDFDNARATSFKNILKDLNAEKNALIKENKALKEANRQIKRQKQQFTRVVFLFFTLMVCGIGLFLLYDDLNDTQDRLDSANNTITRLDSVIVADESTIKRLGDSVAKIKTNLQNETSAKQKAEKTLQTICSFLPFVVKKCEVSSTTFKFDYFCPEEKNLTVTLKAINENNSEIITNTHTLTFYKGNGSKSLDFSRSLNFSHCYYVVIICNGRVIAGTRW
ncbi:MAG: hypothetical protein K2G01_01410 [Paramuribaculum sp.]|nr:hypothetical protein [Paramuribaculum sp.]